MQSATLPNSNLDPVPAQNSLSNAKHAIDNCDYDQAVDLASIAIDNIQRLQLLTALDHRAYALGMKSKFDDAVKDAQDMIQHGPAIVTGYLRAGELYAMQGKYAYAISTYEKGLEKVSKEDPEYTRLIDAKKAAVEKNVRCVDFIACLPVEIGDDIIINLPEKSKAICLAVSRIWRTRIMGCRLAWVDLINDDESADIVIATAVPHIAPYVEDLTITTENLQVWLRYLEYMENGSFSKVGSLEVTAAAAKHISTNSVMSLTSVFWQMRYTLDELHLDFAWSAVPISLVDILFYCTCLETLLFSTSSASLTAILGELDFLDPHGALIDMELRTKSMTGEELEPLLEKCQKLRRLTLNGATPTVLDAVNRSCPNLEIFGFNPSFDLPELYELKPKAESGLRAIYTANGGFGVPPGKFLPLIRKNMKTLETVYANLSQTETHTGDEESFDHLNTFYKDLKLENLEFLTYWTDTAGDIQPLVLRSISSCTNLTRLSAVDTPNIPALVETLLNLPPLETLELSHISATEGDESLVRLFKKYVTLPNQKFRAFWFRYCHAITDSVLDAVAELKTLEEVTLTKLPNVSAKGIEEFLKKLGNKVTEVKLIEMQCATDAHIDALCNLEGLKNVHLEYLTNVTDEGIRKLIDTVKSLRSLTLTECKSISKDTVLYAKRKIKKVEINE
ncbi:hypothetical protein BJV82DRAFT_718013 [Fennellomyces sp. T-0311]|nr:hypothetical protein BJV82DRAFT_718013 [Fennellomyces sp. T-0311]